MLGSDARRAAQSTGSRGLPHPHLVHGLERSERLAGGPEKFGAGALEGGAGGNAVQRGATGVGCWLLGLVVALRRVSPRAAEHGSLRSLRKWEAHF